MEQDVNVNVGCTFKYGVEVDTAAIFVVRPALDTTTRMVVERWVAEPATHYHDYSDVYGNECRRMNLPAGTSSVKYTALVDVPSDLDAVDFHARANPVSELPDDVLMYTLPSRYCLSDELANRAWALFAGTSPGWERMQAICDYVNGHVRFQYGTSSPMTTAVDVENNAVGVCRDFTHLGISLARAMNIPARYVFGYLPDIDVAVSPAPMDFAAWFEAYMDGRWWTFDPRNNERRRGRVLIARGRDALDVAMVTTYGGAILHDMLVQAERAE